MPSCQRLVAKINSDKKELTTDKDSDLKKIATLEELVTDLNESVEELNSTIQVLDGNITIQNLLVEKLRADNTSLVSENTTMKNKIAELERKMSEMKIATDEKVADNNQLNNRVSSLTSELSKATNENVSLVNNVNDLSVHVEDLTLELQEAIRVAQVPFTSGWFYDPEDGWLYTDANVFPLIYKHESSSWYFYELGSHNPPSRVLLRNKRVGRVGSNSIISTPKCDFARNHTFLCTHMKNNA